MENKLIGEINYKTLEPVLQRINQNNVNPSENITNKYKTTYQNFIGTFTKFLGEKNIILQKFHKVDVLKPKQLKSRIGRCYNVYEHEILIKLPSSIYKVNVPEPGFVTINLLTDLLPTDTASELKSWTDTKNFITPQKFRDWAEKVIFEAFKLNNNPASASVKVKKFIVDVAHIGRGEFNFHIADAKNTVEFDMKISFALSFDSIPSIFLNHHNDTGTNWLAVPILPCHKSGNNYKNWRYSFPETEKKILSDHNYLKCVLRLIKILKEAADLTHLSNYHIKTVFMLEVDNQKTEFWYKGLSYVFIMMICKLQMSVQNGNIPFYWDQKANLLNDLTKVERTDCAAKLEDFISKIHKSFTLKPPVKLEDFYVNIEDDDDILSQSMKNIQI